MTTPELGRISTAGKVVEYLRRAIETGALSPGGRITELEISGKLGVSRSPCAKLWRRSRKKAS